MRQNIGETIFSTEDLNEDDIEDEDSPQCS